MAKKRITSRPGLFGYTNYYDEKGQLPGHRLRLQVCAVTITIFS